jgi:DNA-binding SARP family transcriptional activator
MAQPRGDHLLVYAISKLNPDVFTHRVWLRFGVREAVVSPNLVENLLGAAQDLQGDDPGSACQILLVCAVCQNHTGQHNNALKTIQQSLALAERAGLFKEALWSAWGASAICFQEKNYEQTATYLFYLQETLNEQNDWLLADYIDIVRQSLPCNTNNRTEKQVEDVLEQSTDGILFLTHRWLLNWGLLIPIPGLQFSIASDGFVNPTTVQTDPALFSIQHWNNWWHKFILAVRNGLNLHQPENDHPIQLPVPKKKQDTSWEVHSPAIVDLEIQPDKKDLQRGTQIMIYCLGSLRVLNSTQFVTNWPSRKAQLVFKYLLLHRQTLVHKETIMEVFWPEADVEAARRNLHQAIYNLRLTLKSIDDGLNLIEFEQGGYRINPTLNVWIDYAIFEQHYAAAQQQEHAGLTDHAIAEYALAEEMYMDHLFAEDLYEDWMRSQREYLRQLYLSAATRLTEYHFQKKDFSSAISIAQRVLQKDPCEENAHQILMRCFHSQGQRQLAIRQYEICCQVLRDELDVEPSSRTRQFFSEILRD